jgi:hypothetical protein
MSSLATVTFQAPNLSNALTIKKRFKKHRGPDGHDVELWERGRFIARLTSNPDAK